LERERELKLLKKENQCLKIQLRDTAEAVQAAGELLVRLREAEQAASVAEVNFILQRGSSMNASQYAHVNFDSLYFLKHIPLRIFSKVSIACFRFIF
jgi:negative regulator of sigma E activity